VSHRSPFHSTGSSACDSNPPGADRTPLIGGRRRLPFLVEKRMNAVLEAVVKVRIDITVVDSRKGVTSLQDHLDRPATAFHPARGFCGTMIDDAKVFVVSHPGLADRNSRVGVHRLISIEVET